MKNEIRIHSTEEVYDARSDLVLATVLGVGDVAIASGLQGFKTTVDTAVTGLEEDFFDSSRNQINADRYFSHLWLNTDFAGPRFDVVVTDQDMYFEGTNFVFGAAWEQMRLAITSFARYIEATPNQVDQSRLVRHVAKHEFAHLLGMNTPEDYVNPDLRSGLYYGHCANECTLHQFMSMQELAEQTSRLEGQEDAGFCKDCIDALRDKAAA